VAPPLALVLAPPVPMPPVPVVVPLPVTEAGPVDVGSSKTENDP
jgi:hypothetical protein